MTTDDWTFANYRVGATLLPEPNLGWNMYGTGTESMGRNGAPAEPSYRASPGGGCGHRVDGDHA